MNNLNGYTKNLFVISILFIICIIVYGLNFTKLDFLKVVPVGVLLAITSFSFGGTLGFIFGLPTFSKKEEEIAYERNTSLKEIADWLTKIIIGVTLVELKSIVIYFQKIVLNISLYLDVGDSGIIFSSTILISFFFIGFVSIYLLTITDVFKYLANNDKNIRQILSNSGENNGEVKVADLIDENITLTDIQKSKILDYVKEFGSKIEDIYTLKRLAKILFRMKEYFYAAELYCKIYDKDNKEIFSKLNEAYIRNKHLKQSTLSNNILRGLIKDHPDKAMPYYNLSCNYNREYREIKNVSNNEDYKSKLLSNIKDNLISAFTLDKGLLSEALSDSELQGVGINEIFNKIYSNN